MGKFPEYSKLIHIFLKQIIMQHFCSIKKVCGVVCLDSDIEALWGQIHGYCQQLFAIDDEATCYSLTIHQSQVLGR